MDSRADEEQEKIHQFTEIVGESGNQARQFLEATGWQLEEAIQLYFAGGIDTVGSTNASPPVSLPSASESEPPPLPALSSVPPARLESPVDLEGDPYVPPPLPVKRDMLYEDIYHYRAHQMAHAPAPPTSVDAFRNFEDEANQRGTNWGGMESSNSSNSGTGGTKDSLAALYRPPFVLMFQGTFEQAKAEAAKQEKWLLVNLQSVKEFSSYTLNRDTWSHEAVKETVSMSFVFWQVYDDTEEGRKVCTYYKVLNMPTTLVLDPLTGQKMRAWEGMILPERLLEDLVPYLDRSPMDRHPPAIPPQKRPRESTKRETSKEVDKSIRVEDDDLRRALAASLQDIDPRPSLASLPSDAKASPRQFEAEKSEEKPQSLPEPAASKQRTLPILPEEPATNSSPSSRVAVRFPDGRRAQRRFLHSDPIQYLWSFACSHVPEAAEGRLFRLTQAIPGATALDFNSTDTIQAAGLGNSMIVMSWE